MGVDESQIKKTKKIFNIPSISNKVFRWIQGRRAHSSNTRRRDKGPPMPILPEDVMTNIFSRLPIECVARSRIVCKRWLALFSSPHFARMHVKRAVRPLILVQNSPFLDPFHDSSLVILTAGNTTKPCTYNLMSMIGTDPATLYGSCSGLLVFKRGYVEYLICNPITREQVTIKQPVTSLTRTCCGILFHPGFEEDLVLFHEEMMTNPQVYEYSTYGVSSKMWRKTCSFAYKPSGGSSPVVNNRRLHWIAFNGSNGSTASHCGNCIVTCNMDLGDFRSMPHPGEKCCDEGKRLVSHGEMQVLEMKGVLCFGDVSFSSIIRIWTMEDYGSWSWLLNFNIYVRTMDLKEVYYGRKPKLLRIEDDSLIFAWGFDELIVYHLIHKTKRVYCLPKPGLAQHDCAIACYTKSFISLRG